MRMGEIRKFSNLLENVHLEVGAVQQFGEGMEWSDVPFPNLKSVEIGVYEIWCGNRKPDRIERDPFYANIEFRKFFIFKEPPDRREMDYFIFEDTPDKDLSWVELLILVDQLVGRSGDIHHRFFEGFEYQDDRLKVELGS